MPSTDAPGADDFLNRCLGHVTSCAGRWCRRRTIRTVSGRGDRRRDQFNIVNLGGDTSGLLIDGAVANMTVLPNQSGHVLGLKLPSYPNR